MADPGIDKGKVGTIDRRNLTFDEYIATSFEKMPKILMSGD